MKKKGLSTEWMLIIAAFAALVIWRKIGDKPLDTGGETGDTGQGYSEEDEANGVQPAAEPDLHKVCQVGSQGDIVKKIQQRMNTILSLLKGKKTSKYYLENQTMQKYYTELAGMTGIKADGVFGPKTLALCKAITGKSMISLNTARKKYNVWKDQDWQKKDSDGIVINQSGGGGLFGTWIHN